MKSKDLIAGSFVFFSFLLFVGFIAWGGRLRGLLDDRVHVRLLMARGVPIEVGAPVRAEGMVVGELVKIRWRGREERAGLHPDRPLELELALDRGFPLAAGTEVLVHADGLLGARFIDLLPGPEEAPPLEKDAVLLGDLGGIDSFLEKGHVLSRSLERIATNLESLLAPGGGRGTLTGLLKSLDEVSSRGGETLARLDELLLRSRGMIDEGRGLARDLRALTSGEDAPIPALLARLDSTAEEAARTIRRVRGLFERSEPDLREILDRGRTLLAEAGSVLTETGTRLGRLLEHGDELLLRSDKDFFLLLHHLRVAAEEFKLLAARLRADPSQLLWGGGESPDEAEAAARRSMERDLLEGDQLPPRWKR